MRMYGNRFTRTVTLLKPGKRWKMSKILGQYIRNCAGQHPDPSMDILLNRWLIYQVLACRMWGRTSFYQSSGAYGFRDQLQDSMALVYSLPEITRQHIIESSRHQFIEGDVQHWWHEPHKGVRTRITDDLLFLPFVVAYYIKNTGDWSILDEETHFLDEEPLKPEEMERYSIPNVSDQKLPYINTASAQLRRPYALDLMVCRLWVAATGMMAWTV